MTPAAEVADTAWVSVTTDPDSVMVMTDPPEPESPAGVEASPETAILVTRGTMVVERALETVDKTVERAGQFVIEDAQEVMVWTNVV